MKNEFSEAIETFKKLKEGINLMEDPEVDRAFEKFSVATTELLKAVLKCNDAESKAMNDRLI